METGASRSAGTQLIRVHAFFMAPSPTAEVGETPRPSGAMPIGRKGVLFSGADAREVLGLGELGNGKLGDGSTGGHGPA